MSHLAHGRRHWNEFCFATKLLKLPNTCPQLYESVFEGELLKETGSFYRKEASSQLQECNVSQYMERVIARLAEEELRATKFLPPRYIPPSCHLLLVSH